MPRLLRESYTQDPDWVDMQVERLLAFEVLRAAVQGKCDEIPPGTLADKLGLDKGFVFQMAQGIRERLKGE